MKVVQCPPGPLMLDVHGLSLEAPDRELLVHPSVGGVVLFARNYESRAQLAALVKDIKAVRDPELLVAVDQEGGRVQRFLSGFTRLPALARIGEAFEVDQAHGLELAWAHGVILAAELLCDGVDLSFAPVLDLRSSASSVIGERAFSSRVDSVVALAQAMIGGMRQSGMASVGKHFPGHGSVSGDSHHGLPVDRRSAEELERTDLAVFKTMLAGGVPAVMMGHVLYPEIDALPACFSSRWIQHRLRRDLNFEGAVFSDDLSMGAAETVGPLPDRAILALDAGCDMVLVCNDANTAALTADSLLGRETPDLISRLARVLPQGDAGHRSGLRSGATYAHAGALVQSLA